MALSLSKAAACTTLDLSTEEVIACVSRGMSTAEIAVLMGVTRRRVQQIVAPFRLEARRRRPTDAELDGMITLLRWRRSEYYGAGMMVGALKSTFGTHFSFDRQRVGDALARLFPAEHAQRLNWATLKLASVLPATAQLRSTHPPPSFHVHGPRRLTHPRTFSVFQYAFQFLLQACIGH